MISILHRLVLKVKSVNILQENTWKIVDAWFILVSIFLDFGFRKSNVLHSRYPSLSNQMPTPLHISASMCDCVSSLYMAPGPRPTVFFFFNGGTGD